MLKGGSCYLEQVIVSLILPSNMLRLLSGHPSSLSVKRQAKGILATQWYTTWEQKCARYTVPWLEEHHPIAMPLSKVCACLALAASCSTAES